MGRMGVGDGVELGWWRKENGVVGGLVGKGGVNKVGEEGGEGDVGIRIG